MGKLGAYVVTVSVWFYRGVMYLLCWLAKRFVGQGFPASKYRSQFADDVFPSIVRQKVLTEWRPMDEGKIDTLRDNCNPVLHAVERQSLIYQCIITCMPSKCHPNRRARGAWSS